MKNSEKEVNKDKVIAVDLGGTLLRVALVKDGEIKEFIKKSTPQNKKELKKELKDSIDKIIDKVEKDGKDLKEVVKGIGISSLGPLRKGVIVNPPNLNLKKFDLKKFISKEFGMRVEVENDAGCAALAEAKLGCKKDNFIVLTLGTGIGGGIIVDNELYNGNGCGGELGHIFLEKDKDFEDLASGKREKKLAKKKLGKEYLFCDLVKIDSKEANDILDEMAHYLGKGIGSLVNVFDPEVVILAGGVREAGKKLLENIEKEANKYVVIPNKAKIRWSKLDEPGILGASLLLEK